MSGRCLADVLWLSGGCLNGVFKRPGVVEVRIGQVRAGQVRTEQFKTGQVMLSLSQKFFVDPISC